MGTYFQQITAICQEAGMHAVRKNRYVILPKDFEKGYQTNVKKPDTDFEFYKWLMLEDLTSPPLLKRRRLWWIQSGFHYQMQHVELWFLIAITAEGLLFEDLWFNVVMYDFEQSNILISLYIFLLRCLFFYFICSLSISEFFFITLSSGKKRTRDN